MPEVRHSYKPPCPVWNWIPPPWNEKQWAADQSNMPVSRMHRSIPPPCLQSFFGPQMNPYLLLFKQSVLKQATARSHSLTTADRLVPRELQCILEDPDNPPEGSGGKGGLKVAEARTPLTPAQKKRASMVKKAIRYFEDKSNRSVSEDNLFTRRKNLAAHLGLDEKVSKKEVQKINTYCLPVPSSATGAQTPELGVKDFVVIEEDEDDLRSKNLVTFLGMKDDLTASIASQGTLCDDLSKDIKNESTKLPVPPGVSGAGVIGVNRGGRGGVLSRSASLASKSKEHVTFKL